MSDDRTEQLRRSWIANAASWSTSVRERKIESRRVATDAAILDAIDALHPRRILDLGCGEGWLSRALAARGIAVTGVDASPELVRAANESGVGTFYARSYEELSRDPAILGETFDVVVANFSLMEEQLTPLLHAIRALLQPDGAIVIQTVHPGDASADEWRVETFSAFEGEWPEPMPWFFRTRASWVRALADCGFAIEETREPVHPHSRQPLSLILICRLVPLPQGPSA
ncbi:MAG TPA: class I SAM-dependent methyltransferase [Thermoanaerobaculia bacterium]|jgi:2-polyprenyl-3-methyl-5-hydroxy-6-metoxy-1,4-benzoquinol methylase|nr:class I SAM-dependent methyltransferase [Thermoanaerobaculia bacterium]